MADKRESEGWTNIIIDEIDRSSFLNSGSNHNRPNFEWYYGKPPDGKITPTGYTVRIEDLDRWRQLLPSLQLAQTVLLPEPRGLQSSLPKNPATRGSILVWGGVCLGLLCTALGIGSYDINSLSTLDYTTLTPISTLPSPTSTPDYSSLREKCTSAPSVESAQKTLTARFGHEVQITTSNTAGTYHCSK